MKGQIRVQVMIINDEIELLNQMVEVSRQSRSGLMGLAFLCYAEHRFPDLYKAFLDKRKSERNR